ncbi:MAG: dimethylargininase [Cellulomonas sp.]
MAPSEDDPGAGRRAHRRSEPPVRTATARHYLMCRPEHFTVSYEINPWMDANLPTDRDLAVAQWQGLHDLYVSLGHTVELIDPIPDLPDMVFAANGATVLDGVVHAAHFHHEERRGEGPAYLRWFEEHGYTTHVATEVNEGQGDVLLVGGLLLAGTGFRTTLAAHAELQEVLGRAVVSLSLVDPHFYHLDTALTVLDGSEERAEIAYFPAAFSPGSQRVLRRLFPDALTVGADDARALGLNAVSDGLHVVVSPQAVTYQAQLRERGFEPIPVDTSELLKGGGGAKCCTLELCTTSPGAAMGPRTGASGGSDGPDAASRKDAAA